MSMAFGQRHGANAPGMGHPSPQVANPRGVVRATPPFPPKPQVQSDNPQSQLPTLSQVASMCLCYKRLAFVILFLPAISATAPVLVNVLFATLNWFTGGFGTICLLTSTLFTFIWYSVLKSVAPNPEKLQAAYEKSQFRLPISVMLLSGSLIHLMASLTSAKDFHPEFLQWAPTIDWGIGIRPAFGLLLLGTAVLLRFVGQPSLVRCSTVPLISNESFNIPRNWLRSLINRTSNPQLRQNMMMDVNPPSQRFGRRYQCPTITAGTSNLIITVILGWITAEIMILPMWALLFPTDRLGFDETRRLRLLVVATTCLTMVLQLVFADFSGSSHELNPKQYNKPMTGSFFLPIGGSILVEALKHVLFYTIATFMVAVLLISSESGQVDIVQTLLDTATLWLLSFSLAASSGVGLYVAILEESAKAVLCIPGSKLTRLVREVTGGEDENHLVDAMLHSILHGNAALVEQVGAPNNSLERQQRQEARRNSDAALAMARIMLGDSSVRRTPEASLEEDILRHSILESLGGSMIPHDNKQQQETSGRLVASDNLFPMDHRHRETIEYWMMQAQLPRAVLLIRSLSTYAAGLGVALSKCSEFSPETSTWLIRPGTLVAAEYSVIALARCFEQAFRNAQRNATNWSLTPESQLISAALNSAFGLHTGLIQFARYLELIRNEQPTNLVGGTVPINLTQKSDSEIMQNHPDLNYVIVAIEYFARATMRQVEAATRHCLRSTLVWDDLGDDCSKWLLQISSASKR
ncbi:expressed unknown protein [Seminavis robusta]|uniref:Uncharacterized protein n=1 Tax=Seminavis robusta TaxID=568900 RepID=A0A9N8EJJ5_9STRA|nr:expressed unknown protein [Seminavis robusta]|eukprot:Sro1102_g241580.1 n/a (752) ;mRNA; f:18384-20764